MFHTHQQMVQQWHSMPHDFSYYHSKLRPLKKMLALLILPLLLMFVLPGSALAASAFLVENNSSNNVTVLGAGYFSRTIAPHKNNWYWVGTTATDITTLQFKDANGVSHTLDIKDTHSSTCASKYYGIRTVGWVMKLTLDGNDDTSKNVCFTPIEDQGGLSGFHPKGKVVVTDNGITVSEDGMFRSLVNPGFVSQHFSFDTGSHCVKKRDVAQTGCRWNTYPLLAKYKDEDKKPFTNEITKQPSKAYYMTARERERYRLKVCFDGEYVCRNGNTPYNSASSTKQFASRWLPQAVVDSDQAIFVMSPEGNIYAFSEKERLQYLSSKNSVMYHSAFMAGGKVAASGKMRVINGEISLINNNSGHYQPPLSAVDQVITKLKEDGYIGWNDIQKNAVTAAPGVPILRSLDDIDLDALKARIKEIRGKRSIASHENIFETCGFASRDDCEITISAPIQEICGPDIYNDKNLAFQDISSISLDDDLWVDHTENFGDIQGFGLRAKFRLDLDSGAFATISFGSTNPTSNGFSTTCIDDSSITFLGSGNIVFSQNGVNTKFVSGSASTINSPYELIGEYDVVEGAVSQTVTLNRIEVDGTRTELLTVPNSNIATMAAHYSNRTFSLGTSIWKETRNTNTPHGSVIYEGVDFDIHKSPSPTMLTSNTNVEPGRVYNARISTWIDRRCYLETGVSIASAFKNGNNARYICNGHFGEDFKIQFDQRIDNLSNGGKRLYAKLWAANGLGYLGWNYKEALSDYTRHALFETQTTFFIFNRLATAIEFFSKKLYGTFF